MSCRKVSVSLIYFNELDLRDNSLASLPSGFGKLNKLEILNLSNNKIKIIPEGFNNLINLKELYMQRNENPIHYSRIN